jgi:hypothetical protein
MPESFSTPHAASGHERFTSGGDDAGCRRRRFLATRAATITRPAIGGGRSFRVSLLVSITGVVASVGLGPVEREQKSPGMYQS